jgi:glycosyltransferase involved in cell wall biosynthesis
MGEGPEQRDIARLVESSNLTDRVEFVPAGPDIDATLRRFHVFVMTSSVEGLPNAAIESLAAGVPVVSTKVGDMTELVVEGKTGALFESDVPDSMAATLSRALLDRALLESAAAAGPKLVEERFSLKRAVKELSDVYRALAR